MSKSTRCPRTGRFVKAPTPANQLNLAEWQRAEAARLRAWDRFDWCLERLLWVGIGMAILVVAEVIWLRL